MIGADIFYLLLVFGKEIGKVENGKGYIPCENGVVANTEDTLPSRFEMRL
jgi:hypothetical protein